MLAIVEFVDEVADAGSGLFEGFVFVEIGLHVFEGPDEAFCLGVVTQLVAKGLHSSAYHSDVIGIACMPHFILQLVIGYRIAGIDRNDPK